MALPAIFKHQVKHHSMKGILLKELLFHKTIAGQKTETRRTLRINKYYQFLRIETPTEITKGFKANGDPIQKEYPLGAVFSGEFYNDLLGWFDESIFIPRYTPGEKVYIKEPYAFDDDDNIIYAYSLPLKDRKKYSFRNKLFMAEKNARYYIEITKLDVQRIVDISAASVKLEGLDLSFKKPDQHFLEEIEKLQINETQFNHWQLRFFKLFRDINPTITLDSWVWVYSYKLVKEL